MILAHHPTLLIVALPLEMETCQARRSAAVIVTLSDTSLQVVAGLVMLHVSAVEAPLSRSVTVNGSEGADGIFT